MVVELEVVEMESEYEGRALGRDGCAGRLNFRWRKSGRPRLYRCEGSKWEGSNGA